MSRNNDDAALLRALDREGGQVPFCRLTMNGLMAASRLVRKQLAWIDKEAEGGWALVLTSRDGKSGQCSTVEPSGELPVGDVAGVGEAAVVCERAGWARLRAPSEPQSDSAASTGKEYRDGCR